MVMKALLAVVSSLGRLAFLFWQEESDDYESPDDDPEGGVDYETPNDNGIDDENDADYEPPPSNDDDALRNVIFPSKSMPATSEYIGNFLFLIISFLKFLRNMCRELQKVILTSSFLLI